MQQGNSVCGATSGRGVVSTTRRSLLSRGFAQNGDDGNDNDGSAAVTGAMAIITDII